MLKLNPIGFLYLLIELFREFRSYFVTDCIFPIDCERYLVYVPS